MNTKTPIQFNDDSINILDADLKKESEIKSQVIMVNQPITMISMIQKAASDPNTDVSKMETLWRMKQEIDAKEAETAFNLAMGICQSSMTFIQNDCYNPQTRSRYASYKQLDKALRPIYTVNGFALSFNVESTSNEDLINILCYVTHREGHSRTYSIPMPNDGKGAKGGAVMTKAHATGGASSYGMRYLLKMIFNVAIGEEDSDGNTIESTTEIIYITEEQKNKIHAMLTENDMSMSIFLSWLDKCLKNTKGIDGITTDLYQIVIDKINKGIKSKVKNS